MRIIRREILDMNPAPLLFFTLFVNSPGEIKINTTVSILQITEDELEKEVADAD